jgi:hypothetical protein
MEKEIDLGLQTVHSTAKLKMSWRLSVQEEERLSVQFVSAMSSLAETGHDAQKDVRTFGY